jgi:hypothetical protein
MKRSILILSIFSRAISSYSQDKVAGYLSVQYNKTLYDVSKGNNPYGIGLGLGTFFNSSSKLKPSIEITADAYLEDDKVLRMDGYGQPILDVGSMINIFAGVTYYLNERIFLSILVGPSFINGVTIGTKAAMGFYLGKRKRITGKIGFINVFNRNTDTEFKGDFGSINFAIGFKVF